jgi:phospholipid/cholesterol/gamma-HCH transport system permease protein
MGEEAGRMEPILHDGVLTLRLVGGFAMSGAEVPGAVPARGMVAYGPELLRYESDQLGEWDSSLVALLYDIETVAAKANVRLDHSGLPGKLREMLDMALGGPQRASQSEAAAPNGLIAQVGIFSTKAWGELMEFLEFSGLMTFAMLELVRGRSKMRMRDFWAQMQAVSVDALPIVVLISFLVGLIIAFLGAVVLQRFGAEQYISWLVGYGILREMGAIMTGVIMAGRTGAAYAAQLGSMKVSEEIDALKTLGISPFEFLALPRFITLVLMMPLLTVFADLIGILGGYLVAVTTMGVPSGQFFTGLDFVVGAKDVFLGLGKALVFGVLIASSGCMKGFACGNSADDVGIAATRAVVMGITLIIFANAIIDWAAAHLNI